MLKGQAVEQAMVGLASGSSYTLTSGSSPTTVTARLIGSQGGWH
ncbi:hypothetical protein [Hallella sp.]